MGLTTSDGRPGVEGSDTETLVLNGLVCIPMTGRLVIEAVAPCFLFEGLERLQPSVLILS